MYCEKDYEKVCRINNEENFFTHGKFAFAIKLCDDEQGL
jgi:hypothetical protein